MREKVGAAAAVAAAVAAVGTPTQPNPLLNLGLLQEGPYGSINLPVPWPTRSPAATPSEKGGRSAIMQEDRKP